MHQAIVCVVSTNDYVAIMGCVVSCLQIVQASSFRVQHVI